MQILNSQKIDTYPEDDFLYIQLQRLLQEIRLTQGGTALDSTLKRHNNIRLYLISKQIEKIKQIESDFFLEDGSLNLIAVRSHFLKNKSLQKK